MGVRPSVPINTADRRIYYVITIYNLKALVIRYNRKCFAKNKTASVNIYLKNTKETSISFETTYNLLIDYK